MNLARSVRSVSIKPDSIDSLTYLIPVKDLDILLELLQLPLTLLYRLSLSLETLACFHLGIILSSMEWLCAVIEKVSVHR